MNIVKPKRSFIKQNLKIDEDYIRDWSFFKPGTEV